MKTTKLATVVYTLALAILASLIFFGCSKDDETVLPSNQSILDENDEVLRHQEKAGLLQLVELQKFHSDVYAALYDCNQNTTFCDLSKRDLQFQKILGNKACEYGLENPSDVCSAGEYTDGNIRKMYLDFIMHHSNDELEGLRYANHMEMEQLSKINTCMEFTSHTDIIDLYVRLVSETQSQIRILEDKINKYESVEAEANLIRDY
jgi:hypothetical protein